MKIKDLMTQNVVCVAPDEMASVAARMLSHYNIGSMPVCEQGKLQGLITDRDIVLRCVAAEKAPAKTPVREIMTGRVISVSPEEDAQAAADLMAKEQIRRLPVAENGKVVGMVSLGDLSVNRSLQMEASECLSEICHNIKKK